jgi:hypothetical protein
MANPEEFKGRIRNIVSQDYQIEFLGNDFDQIVKMLTPAKEEKIYKWVEEVTQRNIQPITVGESKPYKQWKMHHLLIFRHQFSMNNHEYRIMFVKVKNAIYIEFHLGDHKYYDTVRKQMRMIGG